MTYLRHWIQRGCFASRSVLPSHGLEMSSRDNAGGVTALTVIDAI